MELRPLIATDLRFLIRNDNEHVDTAVLGIELESPIVIECNHSGMIARLITRTTATFTEFE